LRLRRAIATRTVLANAGTSSTTRNGWIAITFGAVSQALGLLGQFSKVAFADINPAVLALENLWLITVAVTLLVNQRSSKPQPIMPELPFGATS
jgi:hypothetical protein